MAAEIYNPWHATLFIQIQLFNTNIKFVTGVEFGARMITIDGKQIKLQIWDTVSKLKYCYYASILILVKHLYNYTVF